MEKKNETAVVGQCQDNLKEWVRPEVVELKVNSTANGADNPSEDGVGFS